MTTAFDISPTILQAGDVTIRINQVNDKDGIVVMAPHGGGIEPGTDHVAAAIASDMYCYYAFCGTLPIGNRRLHRPSHRFNEPSAQKMAQNASTVVTVHGCAGEDSVVYVGGLDKSRGHAIAKALDAIGITARTDPPKGMRGEHPDNLCNQGLFKMGVQLELSMGLRKRLPGNPMVSPPVAWPALHRFARAIQKALVAT